MTETEIKYHPKSQRLTADIDGTSVELNPVLRSQYEVAKDSISGTYPSSGTTIVHHDDWASEQIDGLTLHRTATTAFEKYQNEFPTIDYDLIEFGAEEVALGNTRLMRWNHDRYDAQILSGLEDVGLTWLNTSDKERAEYEIEREGLPLLINRSDLPKDEMMVGTLFKFLDNPGLVKNAIAKYDHSLAHPTEAASERFKDMNLDLAGVGIGYKFFRDGKAGLRLHLDQ